MKELNQLLNWFVNSSLWIDDTPLKEDSNLCSDCGEEIEATDHKVDFPFTKGSWKGLKMQYHVRCIRKYRIIENLDMGYISRKKK